MAIKSFIMIFLCFSLFQYSQSTSCVCTTNLNKQIVSLQCEGQHVASDCRCRWDVSYPFVLIPVDANEGCAVEQYATGFWIRGGNCPGGSTNHCTFTIEKKPQNFLEFHESTEANLHSNLTFLDESVETKENEQITIPKTSQENTFDFNDANLQDYRCGCQNCGGIFTCGGGSVCCDCVHCRCC